MSIQGAQVTETSNIVAEPDLVKRLLGGEVIVARHGLQQAGLFDEMLNDSIAAVRAHLGDETTDKILAVGFEQIHTIVPADKIPAVTEAIYQVAEAKAPAYLAKLIPALFGRSNYYYESAPNVRFHIPFAQAKQHASLYSTFAEKRGEGKLTAHGPHRDSWLDCPDNGVNIWIAFGRVRKGNGLTIFTNEYNDKQEYTEIGEVTDRVPLSKPATFDLEPGDFVAFHTDHLHGSELNRTDETRFVISFRMSFDKPKFPLGHYHSYQHAGLAAGPLKSLAALPSMLQPSFVRSGLERTANKILNRKSTLPPAHNTPAPAAPVLAAELVVGQIRAIDEATCVARLSKDSIVAFSRRCPHKGADLSNGYVSEGRIVCPWHNLPFDPQSGASACEGLRPLIMQEAVVEGGVVSVVPRAARKTARKPAVPA